MYRLEMVNKTGFSVPNFFYVQLKSKLIRSSMNHEGINLKLSHFQLKFIFNQQNRKQNLLCVEEKNCDFNN